MQHASITAAPEPNTLFALANQIVAAEGEGSFGDAFKPAEWLNAAQIYIDTNGDDPDLQHLLDEQTAWEAFADYAWTAQFRVTPLDYDIWREGQGDRFNSIKDIRA